MEVRGVIDRKEYIGEIKGKMYRIYRDTFNRELLLDYEEKRADVITEISHVVQMEEENRESVEANKGIVHPVVKSIDQVIKEQAGPQFLERIAWCALKAHNPKMPPLEKFVDGIERYGDFIAFGALVFDGIFSSMLPVEPEPPKEEEEEITSKKN